MQQQQQQPRLDNQRSDTKPLLSDRTLEAILGTGPWPNNKRVLQRLDYAADLAHQTNDPALLCASVFDRQCLHNYDKTFYTDRERLRQNVVSGLTSEPYTVSCMFDSSYLNLKSAQWRANHFPAHCPLGSYDGALSKMTIGVVGSYFGNAAASFLMNEVLHHFITMCGYRVNLYPTVKPDGLWWNEDWSDTGVSISMLDGPSKKMAQKIYDDQVTVLIDLNVHCGFLRPDIMAHRPAPFQISWAGYTGVTAYNWMTHVIADDFVLPIAMRKYFTEKVIALPRFYYPFDTRFGIIPVSRADYDFSGGDFIVACFNTNKKYTPEFLAMLLDFMNRSPRTKLWMLDHTTPSTCSLYILFAEAGFADRVTFSRGVPREMHLGRLQLADMVFDTWPYGGHTLSMDALWAGCPVLTLCTSSIQSRMSAGALLQAGLPQFVCHTPTEFVNRAVEYADDRSVVKFAKQFLRETQSTNSLFDQRAITTELSKVFESMRSNYDATK